MGIQLSDHFTYRKLIRFTLPSIIMMMIASIYGVVDGFFVSNYAGKIPFAAINLIMPVLNILATVGFMFGTGGTAIVSIKMGEGKKEKANQYFSLFVYTAFGLSCVFAFLGIIFIRLIAVFLGAEGELLRDCVSYSRIILIALPFHTLEYLFKSFFVAAEKPQVGLNVTLVSGTINIVLDAILVVLLPYRYKLMGAAFATAISQCLGGVIPIIYFARENSSILRLGRTNYEGRVIMKACINGSSEFMSNISANIVGMLYNIQLLKYAGEDGVAAYGVMMYASMFFSAAFIGYSLGTAPVIGYHYGAQNCDELKGLLKRSLILIGICGLCTILISELGAEGLANIFVGYDDELLSLTVYGFRVYAISLGLIGFAGFGSSFFTALNDGITSSIISFIRTIVFQCGGVICFPFFWGINGIWISIVFAELMASVLTAFFLVIKKNKYYV